MLDCLRRIRSVEEIESIRCFPPTVRHPIQRGETRDSAEKHKVSASMISGSNSKPGCGERNQEPSVITGETHPPGGNDATMKKPL